jgi:hypothetical protein
VTAPGVALTAIQTSARHIGQEGVIVVDANDTVTLTGVTVAQLHASDFQFSENRIPAAAYKLALAHGVELGRPQIDSAIERKVRKQLAKGIGILRVAKSLGIGTGTCNASRTSLVERRHRH